MKLIRLIGVLALALGLASGPVFADKKPLEHFFKKPQYTGFQLSPNGKELAGLVPVENRLNLAILDLETMQARVITGETRQDIRGFQWASNERLLYFMDQDGAESFGITAVNSDGSQWEELIAPAARQVRSGAAVIRITSIQDLLEDDPENILVSNNDRRASYPDLYIMNIYTGRKKMVHQNPGNVTGWFTDWDGKVVGAAFQDGASIGFSTFDEETETFTEVTRARYDEHTFSPVNLSGDGANGWVSSRLTPAGEPRDKAAIYEYNFDTHEFGEMVFEHDVVDVTAVIMSEKERDMIGVSYMVGEPERAFTDERWARMMAGIDQALPDTVNVMSSVDDEETIGVVASYSDRQPTNYYLYHFDENRMEFLAASQPWVEPAEMAEMKPISFQARDGLTLYGYLTVPPNSEGKKLPLIVNPHGGPWARDGWGYNAEHQFLADRGYAVIQVNFRGSTGFGMDHYLKSKRQWGQAMQSDVTDALNWAVEQGIADPERVCIYGASYGGYATMAGLTFTPDLYQCGINYVGVTDLPLLFKTAPDAWEGFKVQMADMVGDPKEEREFLQEWSPSNHADKIKAPVFMAYGKQDPRVDLDHAKVMEKALKKHGKEYELMVKNNEGHGFRKQENVYDFYGRVDTFLAENLNP